MGEIKSVKVDNWGVFFLQKLQNFFNKTDYCDLTLQFRDNSQLKVHRLVLSACTDYFNVLEQTCEVIDDALIMPNELQADVVVPIVNFMYTGTLEFELKMYGKLLRTAKEMNMTVLLKLLEAHRRTMENVNKAQRPPSPKAIRRRGVMQTMSQSAQSQNQNQNQAQQQRIVGVTGNNLQKRFVQTKTVGTNVSPGVQIFRQQIGSTSVVRTSALKANQPNVQTYIKNEPDEYESITATNQPTSPFEQLRKGYNNNKRPAITTFSSPPSKKPNLEDVKEFAEQQRMRKQIAAEYGEDQEFEGMMDDDIHNDDDDDDGTGVGIITNAPTQHHQSTTTTTTTVQTDGVRNTSITFKHEQEGQPPTIIVKDSSGSKLNHAKIISEVLRQYPHLAKGNKNIKLKIMPNAGSGGGGQTQKVIVKKEPEQLTQHQHQHQTQQVTKTILQQKANLPAQLLSSSQVTIRAGDRIISQGGVAAARPTDAIQKTTLEQQLQNANANAPALDNSQPKRRIDSKTMHALIAQGAENMTGPWLCLRCGVNGRPISIPSYRGFRRHLINTHKETIDPALCEHCGWRSRTNRELHFHMQKEHKIRTALYTFPECVLCVEIFLDTNALNQHTLDSHPSANKQQCIYCNKIFVKEIQLYTHMKLYHKHQALEDGIIDASDEEFSGGIHGEDGYDDEENMESDSDRDLVRPTTERKDPPKVKILSDISLPMTSSIIKMGEDDNMHVTNTIDAHTKFVTADGSEMLLTEEQRKEIMSQLNQDHNNGGVVMVLQEAIYSTANEETVNAASAATDGETLTTTAKGEIVSEEDEDMDDNKIYDELATAAAAASQNKTADKKSDSKETLDNLEWAENLISEHDLANAEVKDTTKKHDVEEEVKKAKKIDLSEKLKELTGDWSEDENEEEEYNIAETEKNDAEKTDADAEEKTESHQIEEQTVECVEKDAMDSADDSSKKSTNIEQQLDDIISENDVKKELEKSSENIDCIDEEMQHLHGEDDDIKVEKNVSNEALPTILDESNKLNVDADQVKSEADVVKADVPAVPTTDSNVIEQNAAIEIQTTSDVADQNRSLLDELMSATATVTATQSSLLVEQKNKIIDDFDEAELNDVEEFTSIDKEEKDQQEEIIAKKENTISSVLDNNKSSDETKDVKDTITTVTTTEINERTTDLSKSLTSNWEDIQVHDDDDDDVDGGIGEVIGSVAE